MRRDIIVLLVGALVAVVLQIILAPNIAIFSAMPNFLLAYVMIVAILRPDTRAALVLAFVLGLLYDLMSHTPVGSMAFLLVLFAFLASRVFSVLDNDSVFMPILIYCVAALIIEVLYAVFMLVFGVSAGVVEVLVYRALPCAIYDCVIGLILYPLMTRLFAGGNTAPTPGTASMGPAARTNLNVTTGSRRRVKKSKKMPRF